MSATRIRKVHSSAEFQSVRDDFITLGYSIKNEGENTSLLEKASWGSVTNHAIIAVLTAWWTFGIVNLLYALYVHNKKDEVLIKYESSFN